MSKRLIRVTAACALLTLGCLAPERTQACTRVVYAGHNAVATGRTLDWREPIPTSLRIFPRGEKHESYDDPTCNITWVSKYGSVTAVSYDMGIGEGMNEAGLAVNVLYLPGSVYELPDGQEHRKKLSSSVWPQFFLDQFATVEEAMKVIKQDILSLIHI